MMVASMACSDAHNFAGPNGPHWNRLFIARLQALGFKLIDPPASMIIPDNSCYAPSPSTEGTDQYLYPSLVVPDA